MIAYIITAALLADPSPKVPVETGKPPVATPAVSRPQTDGVLAGVAVTLECTARPSGLVVTCQVLEETHPGLGFGEAAIALLVGAEVAPAPRARAFARTIQFTP